ncbi:hypothetical protein J3B02_002554 [Coemansia erecta]|uniref:ribonucleoside-triphosphate reductase (thioredoxin) n=1 Tax=Coemansia asiatica TaxID=1052880 RepID=A0A9W8CJA4_9FUNG|nr:hypothetical protein LPJ64_004210 [Coemansia asiatica]KAJ2854680.1 hypothetical protein J3B02_002554 [Coemansia erecta]KAJ2884372.1 hypothetical protein FB639_001971 [Coemansia asiatica]
MSTSEPFTLDRSFVSKYADKPPPFGFNGLGEIVYRRTYSRLDPITNAREKWHQTVTRVVTGTFRRQQEHILQQRLAWDAEQAQQKAQAMYKKIFSMKFLPPGRGLWAMGSPLTEERRLFAALNNCAFVSTSDMWDPNGRPSDPFTFLMDAAMLGVGVGFDTKGAESARRLGRQVIASSDSDQEKKKQKSVYCIPDTREGWVHSVRLLIDSYLDPGAHGKQYQFDYSLLRPLGSPIRGFGGIASGPEPLCQLHEDIRRILGQQANQYLSVTSIVDLMNLIGKCVVSGNVRRTAEIAFGEATSSEYLDLKNYKVNPHRAQYGWTSNNSVFAKLGMDYSDTCRRILDNGEPGLQWMQNARKFGRMDEETNGDMRVAGANPCGEQSLESYEVCCLVETFPDNHRDLAEYLDTLECALLYAKTVTLLPTHWPRTNQVMMRNRRIGTSVSGVAQFITHRGIGELAHWLDTAYRRVREIDQTLSEQFCVPRSVKLTSVKPSGTVSLLAGATPGMHYPESRFCIRRVRIGHTSEMLPALRNAGYHTEPDLVDPTSVVVEIPIDHGEGIRPLSEISMWEQLSLAALLQKYWSDNQVSCTVTFDPEKEGPQLSRALDYFQYKLKSISFLPRIEYGAFKQMPYEAIDEEKYLEMISSIEKEHQLHLVHGDSKKEPEAERFCTSDHCIF